jgi:hypothetical protein
VPPSASERRRRPLISIGSWFDRIDPGTHRSIKGLRLVTAFGLAALLAIVPHISRGHAISLGPLAAGFALWASVSEAKTTRYESARDLAFLCIAAGLGAASLVIFTSLFGAGWSELTLISGSSCAGFLRRFGVLGSGIGSHCLPTTLARKMSTSPRSSWPCFWPPLLPSFQEL